MTPTDAEEQDKANGEAGIEAEAGLTLAQAREKADEYLSAWKRAQADFVNYKRRTEQDRLEMGKYAASQVILGLLPVLDDFELAFGHASARDGGENWMAGVKFIQSKFHSVLEAQGVKPIEAVGKPFDPAFHEAVMRGKGEDGIVVKEMRKGYMIHDRVLRPTQVVVGNDEEE